MIKIFDGKKESAYLMRKTADINILGKCAGAGEGAGAGAGGTATGSTTFGTTVTHYDLGAASVAGEPAFVGRPPFDGAEREFYLIVKGDFGYDQLTGTRYIENCYNEVEVGDGGYYHKFYTQEDRTIKRSDWLVGEDSERYAQVGRLYVFPEGASISLSTDSGSVMHAVETPGIYFAKDTKGDESYLIEMDLAVSTVIDERCLPLNAITKSDLVSYQASWYVEDLNDPRYIQGKPCYSTVQSRMWGEWPFLNEDDPVIVTLSNGKKMYLVSEGEYPVVSREALYDANVDIMDGDEERTIIHSSYDQAYYNEDDGSFYINDSGCKNPFTGEQYEVTTLLIVYAPTDNYTFEEGVYNPDTEEYEYPVFPKQGVYALYESETKYVSGFSHGLLYKLDEEYIPELSQVILKSSTPYSWKKFKVTVNDEGQLTAEEIPEE